MRLRNAMKLGYSSMEDVKETMAYFIIARITGMAPWDIDSMDCTMVDEWLEIISRMGDTDGVRR